MILKTHGRLSTTILTTEGWITYSRNVLYPKTTADRKRLMELENHKSVVPLDMALGIDGLPFKVTPAMMLNLTKSAILYDSYEEVETHYKEDWNIEISDDLIREIVDYVGAIVWAEDCRQAKSAFDAYDPTTPLFNVSEREAGTLYIEMDGAMFNTRVSKDGSTWRENKLALVYNSKHVVHRVNKNGNDDYKILEREYIGYVGTVDEFKKHLVALCIRNNCERVKDVVILSDGATWIKNLKDEMFPCAEQILDLYHLKENVGKFAVYIFHNDKTKYSTWSDRICGMLENGEWQEVLKELAPYKDKKYPLGVPNLYKYIWNHRDCINYPRYRRRGWIVGSGAIESGNKTVLQERLKLPGMRWDINKAQGVIALRAKYKSNMWNTYVVPLVTERILSEDAS